MLRFVFYGETDNSVFPIFSVQSVKATMEDVMRKKCICLVLAGVLVGTSLIAADPASTRKESQSRQNSSITITSLPDEIKLIIGETKEQNYSPRVKAIHALPANLSEDQIQACYHFLYKKIETQKLPDLQFNALKNELVFVLMRQKKKPTELAGHLVKMYKDKSFDTTWRDYCVQFFGKWYPNAPDNQGRKDMAAGLWDALQHERGNRIAGGASAQLCFLSRLPLMHTCALLGNEKVLPIARKYAQKGSPMMRASAIGVIGIVGTKDDIKMLEELASARDIRLQRPAKVAIDKIKSRTK